MYFIGNQEIYTGVISLIAKEKDMESCNEKMGQNMKESGSKEFNMDRESLHIKTVDLLRKENLEIIGL